MDGDEQTRPIRFKIRKLKNITKNLPTENPFDFTQTVEEKKEDEMNLGLFSQSAEAGVILL